MTTDGGGWVLIGRGRENWTFTRDGQGTSAQVAATVDGTAAFEPKHLPEATVDGLLDGGTVSSLADGLRIRRATNTSGTTWQEVRLHPNGMGTFQWTLGGGYSLASVTFDNLTYTPQTTSAELKTSRVQVDSRYRYLSTLRESRNEYKPGFGLGASVYGSTSSTSYLWSPSQWNGYALPFAQLWVRPTLRWADLDFPEVGDGLQAQTQRTMFDNYAESQTWGVTGLANGFSTERDTEVRSMVQVGQRMFVGGNFARVVNHTTGEEHEHSYLAAFDVDTGEWIPGFAPVLDGKVNALEALPDGSLAVGGEFTTVDGVAHAGLVVLDPTTGEPVDDFGVTLERRASTGTVPGTVTALDVQGTWLYLGGTFTHVAGGVPLSGFAYAKRTARIRVSGGQPDFSWNPEFNGTPIFVTASDEGDRVYVGGFMSTMNGGSNTALRFVVVTTSTPARPVAGLNTWVSSSPDKIQYQQTGSESGNNFWLGGAEHSFFDYDRSDMSLIRGNITRGDSGSGGDFQTSLIADGLAYGGCHCSMSYNYGGATVWNPVNTFDDIDMVRYLGAYDVASGRSVSEFFPWIDTRAVRGPWALATDTNGRLWVGGDLTRTKSRATKTWQSSGGFARFARNDSTAPGSPTALRSTTSGDTVTVKWTGVQDESGGTVRYRVHRGDHVVATTSSWKAVLPAVTGTSTYTVRAMDTAGNLSASSDPLQVEGVRAAQEDSDQPAAADDGTGTVATPTPAASATPTVTVVTAGDGTASWEPDRRGRPRTRR